MNPDRVSLVLLTSHRLLLFIAALVAALVVLGLVDAPMVPVVLGLGALGGLVGLQRRLKNLSMPDLRLLASSWRYPLLAPLVGGVLALVLYALFISGLLGGELFPKMCPEFIVPSGDARDQLLRCAPESVSAYAKLYFWSFLAGFSERFVVDIIGRFEHRASVLDDSDTDNNSSHTRGL